MGAVSKYLAIGLLLFCSVVAMAQTNPLLTKISIEVHNTTLQQTLLLVAEEGAFSFAYNSAIIAGDSIISYTANDKTVQQVLADLLGPGISYSAVGNHIVLKPAVAPKNLKPSFAVAGQILSAQTGEVLQDVSVYSNVKLKSDITDGTGSYSINLNQRKPLQVITISKIGYQDTTVVVNMSDIYNLNISLTPIDLAVDTIEAIEKFRLVNFFTNKKQRTNAINIKDSLQRFAQFSFVPIMGTNYKMSGAITNNLSINFIGGYNGGLKGLELGVGFNIIRGDVIGVQLAVLGNTAGGNVNGVQMAAGYNLNLGSMRGFQASAGVNIQRRSFYGVQMAAGVNYADTLYGLQMANVNIVRNNVSGWQVGQVNYVKNLKGVQLGLINYTKNLNGVQVGLINSAKNARGVQFGLINVADSIKGTPIGMLSIVRKGYIHLDLYTDEMKTLNLSFRTGVSYFHNIITVGAVAQVDSGTIWRVGYGLGSEFSFGKKKRGFSSFDFTVSYVNAGANFITDLNLLSIVNWDVGMRFKKHFALFVGPTVKIYTSQYTNPDTGNLGLNIAWNPLYSKVSNGVLNEVWVGVRGGFRF